MINPDQEHYIDLHMHSLYSVDGELTPTQLVDRCRQAGIRIMAVTDHNSVKANFEAGTAAAQAGIHYVPGIEIDCRFKGRNLHLLGYGIAVDSPDFLALEERFIEQNIAASRERLKRIRELGFELAEEELEAVAGEGHRPQIWTGEMFAEVLLAKPEYSGHELLKPYRPGGARSDNPYTNFYWDYCAQGKPAYVEVELPSLEQAIAIIHKNGGKAVLAHPGISLAGNLGLLQEILPLGLDGVEAGSSYHNAQTTLEIYRWAEENKILVTGGSDYHGKNKPAIKLGGYRRVLAEVEMEQDLQEAGLLPKR
ncbi:MAG: PHP domain-containing protein [Firmicutes bacterium]|nr:PHP domain-containing protein [Bacillota bacterium]